MHSLVRFCTLAAGMLLLLGATSLLRGVPPQAYWDWFFLLQAMVMTGLSGVAVVLMTRRIPEQVDLAWLAVMVTVSALMGPFLPAVGRFGVLPAILLVGLLAAERHWTAMWLAVTTLAGAVVLSGTGRVVD